MKRILFSIVCCLAIALSASAQAVSFKLFEDGLKAADGKNFAVVEFKGKTATEIFQLLFTNAGLAYKDSKTKVIFTLDNGTLKIRAEETDLTFQNEGVYFKGYYELKFEVKDGKLRVFTPTVDEILTNKESGQREKDYSKLVRSWYIDGKLQAKYNEHASYTEKKLNNFVNSVLRGQSLNQDNW